MPNETVVCPDCKSADVGDYKYGDMYEPDHACRNCGIKFDHDDAHFRVVDEDE